jgi:hypothetical protein
MGIKRSDKKNNKAQMKISFGLIFSIILIIVFLAFAFFGIRKFIEISENIKGETFLNDLQTDIEDMWKSPRGSEKYSYRVPKGAQAFCFEPPDPDSEYEEDNAYFIPSEYGGKILEHIDWEDTMRNVQGNMLCFDVKNQKITLFLRKEYEQEKVTISRD